MAGDRFDAETGTRALQLRRRLRRRLRRLAAAGTPDLTDTSTLRSLRSRVLGVSILLGFVASVATSLSNPADAAYANRLLFLPLAPMPLLGLYALARARRLGDLGYLVVSAAVELGMITFLLTTTAPGALRSLSTIFLFPSVQAALFCGRRRDVALMATIAAGGASALSLHRLAGTGEGPAEVAGGVFTYVMICLVVRLLRDAAFAAVDRARRGEVTDPLTGLSNRRGFERHGGQAWSDRAQERKPLALLMVDVDHFKAINDTLGHAAGDDLLCRIADLLQSSLRQGDHAFRLGGEEFVVLARALPGEAATIAERLRRRIETELAPTTVSIGVVETLPRTPAGDAGAELSAQLWRVLDLADGGMYQAKREGRNRVVQVGVTGTE